MVRFLSVCSGIEAASVAWKPLGWSPVGFAEIEKFPSAVLAHHYPDVPNYGDFTKIDTARLGRVDILCGGTPCQAFSIAGLRGSLDDARGNLTLSFIGLAHDLARNNGLRNAVWENVPGVLSTKDNVFGCFLAGLVGATDALPPPSGRKWPNAGMVVGPEGSAAWRVLDAQYFGLAQRRKRVIVVADFGNGADPAAILFEPEGVRRDSPPSRQAGQDVTPTINARTKDGGGLGADFDLDGGRDQVAVVLRGHSDYGPGVPSLRAHGGDCAGGSEALVTYAPDLARCIATREGQSQDFETTTMLVQSVTDRSSHALRAEGADASEDGTGRGTPIICFSAKDYGADAALDLAPTLRAGGHTSSHANAGVMPAIVQSVALRGREGGATAELGDDLAHALRASGGGDKPHVLAFDTYNQSTSDVSHTLRDPHGAFGDALPAAWLGSAVRRLTPRECERLQGFPDDYTAIPWRGKPADLCPDGPRYKSLGNSWAVPKFRWLGARLDAALADPIDALVQRYRAQRAVANQIQGLLDAA